MKIDCCFGEWLTITDIEVSVVRSRAKMMLVGQYFGAEYLRQENGECQYILYVRDMILPTHIDAHPELYMKALRISDVLGGDLVISYWFGNRVSIQDIRNELEKIFPEVEFEHWEEFLKASTTRV